MGKANAHRRQYFKNREAHHDQIAQGSNPAAGGQNTVASSTPQDFDSDNLGLEQLKLSDNDPAWEFSSQSTIHDASQFDFPPIPDMSKQGPFECPFCYMIIVADSQKTWEYVTTFPGGLLLS
ncbi:hypothetical protein PG987_015981 [Apiospora arundinis]